MLRRWELVFKAGQRDLGLAVVLSGEVEAFEAPDRIEQILGTSGPRGFVGDVAMLNGTSAVARSHGLRPPQIHRKRQKDFRSPECSHYLTIFLSTRSWD